MCNIMCVYMYIFTCVCLLLNKDIYNEYIDKVLADWKNIFTMHKAVEEFASSETEAEDYDTLDLDSWV